MKERLTGAIILVVLIVLLVPELLSGPKGPSPTASTSSEEPPLRSYTIKLADDSHSRTAAAEGNGPTMPQPSGPDTPQSGADQQPPAAGSGSRTADTPTPNSPAGDSHAATPPGAAPPQSSAPGGPQTATISPTTSSSESRPQPTPHTTTPPRAVTPRTAKATPAKPVPTKPASPPAAVDRSEAAKGSGWGVQLGVFASHENADRLALEVRVKGFKASVSPVTTGGRKLYRVRVGPVADRTAAQELQTKLKAVGRPPGTVVPFS